MRAAVRRTTWLAVSLALVAVTACSSVPVRTAAARAAPRPSADPMAAWDARRALASYAVMVSRFRLQSARWIQSFPAAPGRPESTLWPFTQAIAASLAVAQLPAGTVGAAAATRTGADLRAELARLPDYWNRFASPPAYAAVVPPHPGSVKFFDDNSWVALDLLRAHQVTGDRADLTRAQAVFRYLVSGWDTNPSHPCPGGIRWRDGGTTRNAVSNDPVAEVAMELYLANGIPSELAWGRRAYGWVRSCLLSPGGLVWDNIDDRGRVDRTEWTYNQGTFVGAATLLYRAAGRPADLAAAERTAGASLRLLAAPRRAHDPPAFVGILAANLVALDRVAPSPAYRQALQAYADWAWTHLRDPRTGLFRTEPGGPALLLDQAGMVRVFAALSELWASGPG